MKKIVLITSILGILPSFGGVGGGWGFFAQTTANRFFYELTFKPKKDSAKLDKMLTVLDIIPAEKSIYQDYTFMAQDSLITAEAELMEKSGVWKDLSQSVKMPKFTYKVTKFYPEMKERYQDQIGAKIFGYEENYTFDWKLSPEKQKIGEYETQKATTTFGGRNWTAWFCNDIPFPDGPYKFHGLPGIIVKIEDDDKNYSWEMKGNKQIDDVSGLSQVEKLNAKNGIMQSDVSVIDKEKFEKSMSNFRADPLAEARPQLTPEVMSQKMPGSDKTVGEWVKEQEKMAIDFFNANDNPIEIPQETGKKKK
ncbi:MAG: GLPGLI family protein [Flavobacteriaceae bacterium]|jgi:GLPGLI family protein|nr:GLPGLI family protein [Flavobacteriaceae bacterium]